ncbi:nucleotidyltransferase domain-containing protein [Fredinandcohnia onubensis]|uniref:nucleotidyltransferase domain-containing protein n=1 Tax=Fredinandcohnia onubensis TaxID=1571209 RepID=UPI0015D4B377|nr:nucleotidyltransferase domain-containing protein [Fredinandcohnia onubensis]
MKEHIVEILNQIEKEYNVKILYACEAGSRTWGISSEESDYDVRFIYIHHPDWYLSIDQKRDVLEIPKHDKVGISVHPLVDMSGWELTKALRLFRKSNPAILEWLHSNITYFQAYSFFERIQQLEPTVFSPIPSMYHYVKMAKGNFKTIQEKGANVKTYINVIRPLLMAKSIEKHNKMVSLDLNKLVAEAIKEEELKKDIEKLIKAKTSVQKLVNQLSELNKFIEQEIDHLELYNSRLKPSTLNPTGHLNQLFRDILTEAWNPCETSSQQ